MGDAAFISICIPAFKRVAYLERLLNSIESQTFRQFEVIITDDSPDNEVRELVEKHKLKHLIRYFKNPQPLGSPANWNEGIGKASSEWIKIMHDDDWFNSPESLRIFAESVEKGNSRFCFSAYTNVLPEGRRTMKKLKTTRFDTLKRFPDILMAVNWIGPPSVTLFKKDHAIVFDSRMKWMVDIDFYIRYLEKYPSAISYIQKPLISIGISASQVTQSSFGNPEIEIPERFMLADKLQFSGIRNIIVFDSWWRFIRNFSIRDTTQIESTGYSGKIPDFITKMIKCQKGIPRNLLQWGPVSKICMFFHYIQNRKYL
jgi:glycosyltransferase involved in cell wall biosynthesis